MWNNNNGFNFSYQRYFQNHHKSAQTQIPLKPQTVNIPAPKIFTVPMKPPSTSIKVAPPKTTAPVMKASVQKVAQTAPKIESKKDCKIEGSNILKSTKEGAETKMKKATKNMLIRVISCTILCVLYVLYNWKNSEWSINLSTILGVYIAIEWNKYWNRRYDKQDKISLLQQNSKE